jgi:hypothetical protein
MSLKSTLTYQRKKTGVAKKKRRFSVPQQATEEFQLKLLPH